MGRYGWSYLQVTLHEAGHWLASDGGSFADERSMLDELGATGWELVAVRERPSGVVFYFKRPRT
jgi:hypothetical protein